MRIDQFDVDIVTKCLQFLFVRFHMDYHSVLGRKIKGKNEVGNSKIDDPRAAENCRTPKVSCMMLLDEYVFFGVLNSMFSFG